MDKGIRDYQDFMSQLGILGAEPKRQPVPETAESVSIRRLERENALLIDHAEMLACALGACPNCWGTISDCEECGGIGSPGAFKPDRSCFDHFVLPVIARVIGRDPFETSLEKG
ncbi:hypothetical protein Q4511_09280 [Paracoccus sp. 1_MG-2023]|uniref:hypothetical protein n=1 Tax=unclassified Paracoccus (in: a-proteobacteria) TaxID=2688777 RepID=UPI001C08A284|nr:MULTISPECIES: hypothetical protein [unclassified Paracoccus (in: a-proteobacteria)]MBU2957227.1 hypothetical protein [Paracoccus sp. C2R09]MDO6669114.1 hypothetical protein [Paracoccus sp. 1_MG-2023]